MKKKKNKKKTKKNTGQHEFVSKSISGKPKRVKRPFQIDGMDESEFIKRNATSIFYHQHEMWEYMVDDIDDTL